MNPGKRRNLFTVQADQGTTRSARGAHVADWQSIGTVWGELNPLQSIEYVAGGQAGSGTMGQAHVTHEIKIRYFAGLSVRHRLKLGNRIFSINFVKDYNERHVEMIVMATEAAG